MPAGQSAMTQNSYSPSDGIHPDAKPLTATQTGPSGIISTVAGDGYVGNDGNGGLAIDAHFIFTAGVAVDSAGNFYITDPLAEVVRKVTVSTGIITAFAGTGDAGYSGDKGPATKAQLSGPVGLAVDSFGNVYIADTRNNVIRKVDGTTGIITTVAGNGYGAQGGEVLKCGPRTDGIAATASSLCWPQGVAVSSEGDLYIADTYNWAIRKVTAATGIITTVAGGNFDSNSLGDGGPAINAFLYYPESVALDSAGNLYIANTSYCIVQKVAASTGIITLVAGKVIDDEPYNCGQSGDGGPAALAELSDPTGVAVDRNGNVFIADSNNDLVRMVDAGNGYIYTVAGTATYDVNDGFGHQGYSGDGGPATYATLDYPESVAIDASGNLFIADSENSAIRRVTMAAVSPAETPVFSPTPGTSTGATTVTIASPVNGATIYYTTDGSLPTTASIRYTAPFSVGTKLITAFATIPGAPNSLAAIGNYFYIPTPVIKPGTENITGQTPVTITDGNSAATIYYTTDGSDPFASQTAKKYAGAIAISSTTTLKAQAELVNAQGYSGWSAEATATYTLNGAPTVGQEWVYQSSANEIQFEADIDPNNESTDYWFAFGTSPSTLTNTTSTVVGLTGTTSTNASVDLGGFTPNATYYFQAVASNSLGTAKGAVTSFTTDFYTVTPVIAPGTEIVTKPVQVSITESNPAAAIYYTTDGSSPQYSLTAMRYTGPITVSTTTAVTAQAEVVNPTEGTLWSGYAYAAFTVPAAPTVSQESESEQSATQVQLSTYILSNGADTQYWFAYGTSATALTQDTAKTPGPLGTDNGSEQLFAALSGLNPNTTYYFQGVASNSVGTTKGAVQSFATDYYVSAPAISPGSENIAKPIKVTMTQSNPVASIYYTTDGSFPCYNLAAIKYNGPITISASTNLTAATEVQNQQSTLCSSQATATYILPAAPTVSNEGETQYAANSVQLSANIDPNGESTDYRFVYGTAANALTSATTTTVGLTGLTSTGVSVLLNGLTPNTTYYYQAIASNSAGTTKGAVTSFTTDFYAAPPVILPATEIVTRPIQVTMTEANPVATIYYTTDGSYPDGSAAAQKYTGPITISTTTTVNAQAEVTNAIQGTQWSGSTLATYTVPSAPTIISESDYEQSGTQDQLSAYVNADGANTQCWFAYGTSASALTQMSTKIAGPAGTNTGSCVITLSGLTPNTAYFYQAVASNSVGIGKGAVQSFTTDYYAPIPVFSPGSEDIAKPIKVTITQSNPVASILYTTDGSQPCYSGTATMYNGPITISSTTVLTAITKVLSSQFGNLCGATATATYVLPAAPTITNEYSGAYWTNMAQVSADIDPNGETTEFWVAYGTSATSLTSKTAVTGGLTGAASFYESMTLNGLTAQTTYYYQAVASNSLGTAKGPVQSFTTQ
jgi:hypothetical protein